VLVYELYERSGPLLHTVNDIRRYVFISVGVGVGLLGILLAILIIRHGVHTMRRQRQTERLLGDLIRIQDEERSRIIGSLHDDVGQPLYRILFGLEECRGRVGPESQVAAELLHIEELARSVDSHLRSELRLLDAGITGELDLVSGLRALAAVTEAEAGISVDLETSGSVALPPVYRSALLRAAHEGVINVRKHAYANEVKITVSQRGDMVWLEVADDGVGLTGGKGLGIVTTTERLEAIGGGLKVTRRRTGGTLFQAWVPAEQPGGQE
jgi:signal transduction histidine kinase